MRVNKKNCHLDLDSIVAEGLKHLKSLGYTQGSVSNYEYQWGCFLKFKRERRPKDDEFTSLTRRFLEREGVFENSDGKSLTYRQHQMRTAMRVLTDFYLHGCIQARINYKKGTSDFLMPEGRT